MNPSALRLPALCPTLLAQLVLAVFLLVGSGCSQPRYPVSGQITYSDGRPYQGGGTVVFEAGDGLDRIMALAHIQEDGQFRTASEYRGLPAGRYQVRLVAPSPELPAEVPDLDEPMTRRSAAVPPPKPLPFEKKYLDFATSGLEWTVRPRSEDFRIVLGAAPTGR